MTQQFEPRRSMQQVLMDRRDGLLRELDYLEKRRAEIQKQVVEINLSIAPRWPE